MWFSCHLHRKVVPYSPAHRARLNRGTGNNRKLRRNKLTYHRRLRVESLEDRLVLRCLRRAILSLIAFRKAGT